MSQVTSWSYSAYATHAECPLKYKLEKIDKIKVPTPPAFIKGREWHKAMEDFLKAQPGTVPVPKQGARFIPLLEAIQAHPRKLVEQQWAFNRQWRESKWFRDNSTWLRSVLDAGVIHEDYAVDIVDWKTGKYYSTNEDQLELFALTAMVRIPQAPEVNTLLAYLETGDEIVASYSAKDREKLKAKWEKKVEPMFNDTTFAPRPNDNCRRCPFRKSGDPSEGGGRCRFG